MLKNLLLFHLKYSLQASSCWLLTLIPSFLLLLLSPSCHHLSQFGMLVCSSGLLPVPAAALPASKVLTGNMQVEGLKREEIFPQCCAATYSGHAAWASKLSLGWENLVSWYYCFTLVHEAFCSWEREPFLHWKSQLHLCQLPQPFYTSLWVFIFISGYKLHVKIFSNVSSYCYNDRRGFNANENNTQAA